MIRHHTLVQREVVERELSYDDVCTITFSKPNQCDRDMIFSEAVGSSLSDSLVDQRTKNPNASYDLDPVVL